jgi:hypothetical protein
MAKLKRDNCKNEDIKFGRIDSRLWFYLLIGESILRHPHPNVQALEDVVQLLHVLLVVLAWRALQQGVLDCICMKII